MIRSTLVFSLVLFSTCSLAGGAPTVHVNGAWSRALPPVASTGAVYMSIENRSSSPERLIGVSTSIAQRAEIHEHIHTEGVMRMQRVDDVVIEPGQSVAFAPGAHHIMLFDLQQPLVDGEQYPITLRFENAGEVQANVDVLTDAPAEAHHHEQMPAGTEHHH